MRLLNYLHESEKTFMDIINNEVEKSFRDFVRISGSFIYRGISKLRNTAPSYAIIKPREDRNPMNMNPRTMATLDKFFQQKFGWQPRKTGVFTSSADSTARGYGLSCLFFPLGSYEYLFHPGVSDLFIELPGPSKNDLDRFCVKTGRTYPKDLAGRIDEYEKEAYSNVYGASNIALNKKAEALNKEILKFVVDGFQDNKLKDAMAQSTEIVWGCDAYLAVPSSEETQNFILKELRKSK